MSDRFENQTVVLVFAKNPVAGAVMTRLCPPLSHDHAAYLQAACLHHIWGELIRDVWCCPVLVGTPDDALGELAGLIDPQPQTIPQGDGDLGARLERASRWAFDAGAREVIFLGADSPTQDWMALRQVPEMLTRVDVAIGPCCDGGYYFLATRRHLPELFKGIDWSTAHVFEQTCRQANESGLTVCLAEAGYDIDRIEDLIQAAEDLEPDSALAITIRDVLKRANVESQKENP